MEEKERYIFIDLEEGIELIDTENKTALDDADKIKDTLNQQSKRIKELEKQLAESEKNIEHYHKLYNERDKQFQSVRQRYHLLNKLQSNYDKKDKLHLAYMQCKELVDENEKLKQQLHELPKKIVEEIKLQLFNHFKVKNIEEYEKLPLIDSLFTADTVIEILDTILEKFGGEDD